MNAGPCMPLGFARPGSSVTLRRINAGHSLAARLSAMGFVPGVSLEVCQNHRRGPVVVGLKGVRIMLGRGMADKMSVE